MKHTARKSRSTAKLVLALDVDTYAQAKYFVDRLFPRIKIFKVGVQLFTGCGPQIISLIRKKGAQVFLDLKFFDIPHTVARAVRQAVRLGVRMFTLHILGDEEMLKGALLAAKEEARRLKVRRPLLIGVTVLTSKEANPQEVLILARMGLESGCDGVVCSAREAAFLRDKLKRKFVIVTPGIRPQGSSPQDQKRTATLQEAVGSGSDFLVVGRSILQAPDPVLKVKGLLQELNKA